MVFCRLLIHRLVLTSLVVFVRLPCSWADDEVLDEITVTATRRPVDAAEVSAGVTVIASDDVAAHGVITDALAFAAGVGLQQTTPGQGAAIIRGLKGSAVLHLVDGMRLNNAIFRSAPTPYFALVPLASIDRLEVVRGAPASLYGSDVVGGVVHAVTRLPDFAGDGALLRRDVVVGVDSAALQQSLRATVDTGSKHLAASFSAEYVQTGNRRVGGGERIGPSGYSSQALRAVLRGKPGKQQAWLVDLHFLEQPDTPRIDELVPGFGQSQPSSSEFRFAPNQRLFAHVQYENSRGLRNIDWKFDAAWQRVVDDRINRDFEDDERRFETNRSDLFGLTLNGSGSVDSLAWIAGVDVYYDRVHSARRTEDLRDGTVAAVASRFPDGATITQAGLFADIDWPVSGRLSLSGGLRFSAISIALPDAGGTVTIDVSRPSGNLGWIFRTSEHWRLVANIGAGFRAPNIFDLGTLGERPGNRFNIPNTKLGAEHATHGDIGVRHLSDLWRVELLFFALRYRDRITSVSTGNITPGGRDIVQSMNAASSTIHGIEASFAVNLTDSITASGMLNFTRGKQHIAGDSTEPADRILPLHGRVTLRYEPGETWGFAAWAAASASQERLSARDVRDTRIDPGGTPGWATAGFSATWLPGKGWQLVAGVDNVFDKRYRSHGSGLDAAGRNFSMTVRRRW